VSRYEALYQRRAYMPVDERRRLTELLEGPLKPPRERFGRMLRPDSLPAGATRRADPQPAQASLF
jgi:hypothetical protein